MMRHWIEAMRLRTLPVSVAGVIAGIGCARMLESFRLVPALLCLVFAVLAQIASNFANEYFDYKNGIDQKGRAGFRRGVTEGEISPKAMKRATFVTLGLAAAVGLSLLCYGPAWLLIVGVFILLFALAYSAGPYPLSHHGLGDVAVILFFGVVPVSLTAYLQVGSWEGFRTVLLMAFAVGLLAANVLVVNNYRDMEDDAAVHKHTTVVLFGRQFMGWAYLVSGVLAMLLLIPVWSRLPLWTLAVPGLYLVLHIRTWRVLRRSLGASLNPLLGRTALNLLLFAVLWLLVAAL